MHEKAKGEGGGQRTSKKCEVRSKKWSDFIWQNLVSSFFSLLTSHSDRSELLKSRSNILSKTISRSQAFSVAIHNPDRYDATRPSFPSHVPNSRPRQRRDTSHHVITHHHIIAFRLLNSPQPRVLALTPRCSSAPQRSDTPSPPAQTGATRSAHTEDDPTGRR